jgi:hypothetical protein|nr:hypothetical protein [Meiothermus luteus]
MHAVTLGQGEGLQVDHLEEVGQQPLGLLQYAVAAGEVGEGGEVGLEGGFSGEEAFGGILAL